VSGSRRRAVAFVPSLAHDVFGHRGTDAVGRHPSARFATRERAERMEQHESSEVDSARVTKIRLP
jgi:hypothetical protein